MNTNNKNSVFFWSILLVSIGALLLLRNFDVINFNFPRNFINWRLIPLIIGVNAFLKGENFKGIIATTLAVVFYTPDFLTNGEKEVFIKLWPLLLVGFGGLLIYKFFNPKMDMPKREFKADGSEIDTLNETMIMGGSNKKIFTKNFEGGQMNCIMGGGQIDFTEADLSPNAVLNVFLVMGGLELRVPKDWNIIMDVMPIMGGINDQITKFPDNVVDKDKKLFITGNIVAGGVEIKRI